MAADQLIVEVDGFNGPFELLARLIERRELDVTAISLATVTEQYLQHLETLQLRDPEHLSSFLVVATKLLLIKSALLLPRPPAAAVDPEAVVDPTDLSERLRAYQVYRRMGLMLGERAEAGLRSYPRPPVPYLPAAKPSLTKLASTDLRNALLQALRRPKLESERAPLDVEPRVSVAEALAGLRQALTRLAMVRFGDLLSERAKRQHYVATFLAVLEAVRLGLADATQEFRFGEISLTRLSPDIDNARGESAIAEFG